MALRIRTHAFAARLFLFARILNIMIFASGTVVRINPQQVAFMRQFQRDIGDTGNVLINWVDSESCIYWTGVTCDTNGYVLRIVLSDTPTPISPNVTIAATLTTSAASLLHGVIPSVVANITTLQYLVISGTGITGSIPPALAYLKNLQALVISSNPVSGEIPPFSPNFSTLKTLNLSQNHLSGVVPASIGYLTSLQILDLSLNGLAVTAPSGFGAVRASSLNNTIPSSISSLTNLVILNLHSNWFSGYCPTLSKLVNLVELNINQNNLQGNISTILGPYPNIVYLDLSFNRFSGEIPQFIGNYSNLQYMDLSQNYWIAGSVPNAISSLSSLRTLILDVNSLQTLPSSLCSLSSLATLSAYNNNFSGPLPCDFRSLKNLVTLDLSSNGFNGSLPDLTLAKKIQFVNLGYNGFQGGIDSFGHLPSIQNMFLDFVNVSGPIPDSITSLQFLQGFSCRHCFLTGPIPNSIGNLANLTQLDLSENNLTGIIPPSIGKLTLLGTLYLQTNQLTGTLPDDMVAFGGSMSDFQVNGNQLSGNIPSWFGDFSLLNSLVLGSNSFSGKIPPEIGNISTLTILDLSSNFLVGSIPRSLGNLTILQQLFLGNNQIAGTIPVEFGGLTSLQILNVENTAIGGTLPPQLTLLSSLTSLSLTDTQLEGYLPSAFFSNFSQLITLSISATSLQGVIPDVSTLSSLQSLDLSSNHFWGDVPSAFPRSLIDLDISNNYLSGNLSSLANLANLNSLVGDNNGISGVIPDLTHVSFLSLSDNNLTGYLTPNLTDNPHWDISENPICNTSSLQFSTVCSKPASKFQYKAALFCTNTTCFGDMAPNPYYHINFNSCVCSAPATFNVTIYPSYINVFTDSSARAIQTFISANETIPSSLVYVQQALSSSNGHISVTFQVFSTEDYVSNKVVSSILSILSSRKVTFPGFQIPFVGFIRLSNYFIGEPFVPSLGSIQTATGGRLETWVIVCVCLVVFALVSTVIYMRVTYRSLPRQTSFAIRVQKHFVKFVRLSDILKSTNKFSDDNLLGQGGYGTVYIGYSPSGDPWAVKRAKTISLKGLKVFQTEVDIISRMNHASIVKLLGYCDEHNEQILIYEYMPNGTLKNRLAQSKSGERVFSFEDRLDTAIAAAEGLRYLHTFANPTIIHRDVKSENILFDSNYSAKLADFGLLKDNYESQSEDGARTKVAGTPGYIDPEYFQNFQVTTKSDVYSFGVLLLELITGRSALIKDEDFQPQEPGYLINLTQWALDRRSNLDLMADPQMGEYNKEALAMLAQVAFICVEKLGKNRPDMEEVCRRLSEVREESRGIRSSRETVWRSSSSTTTVSMDLDSSSLGATEGYFQSSSPSPLLYNSGSSFSQMSTLLGGR